MKLQELVSHHASALNETDLAVWRYIESHPQECCYISIYDLANRCHVSRTSVLRFAKKLGLDGFSDLKSMLKLDQSRADAVPALNIAEATTNLCQKIGEEIARQDFQRVNKLMYEAKRVFLYPSGLVQRNIASELARLFLQTDKCLFTVNGHDEFRTILRHASQGDLFIIISLSGESSAVVSFAQDLRLKGIPFISLTQLKSNALARLSTENLYVTPQTLPVALPVPYESMLAFFLLAEIWFVSYTHFLAKRHDRQEQDGL